MTKPPDLGFDPAGSLSLVQRQLAHIFMRTGAAADTAMTEARMIVCAALGIGHADLLRDPDRPVGEAAEKLADLAARRAKHEPVSRILGRREFFGLDLAIDSAVLDPRADTETLVEAAIDAMASRWEMPLRILDLGTGSGALLCALLASFPQALGLGIDLSAAACRVAANNLAALGLGARGSIVCGDWTKALRGAEESHAPHSLATSPDEPASAGDDPGSRVGPLGSWTPARSFASPGEAGAGASCSAFDIIVSNPPYIMQAQIAGLDPEVRDYDPHLALDGGEDGYGAYRALIPALPGLMAHDGVVVFELGIGQAAGVGQLFEAAGLGVTGLRRDLAGIERAIVAKRS